MKRLREGFTTGTAAAGAAKGAVALLLGQVLGPQVDVLLPNGCNLAIPLSTTHLSQGKAEAMVIKDGGDDPDVTHGCEVWATARWSDRIAPGYVHIQGGKGIGKVTLPGLPVAVGEWAINPEPLRQIRGAVEEVLHGSDRMPSDMGLEIVISVPDGEELAKHTMNPRLGIVGGISILGTRGTVKPFSHESYGASIGHGLAVAGAQGLRHICFSTGWRSEKYLMCHMKGFPPYGFIQIADLVESSLSMAAARGVEQVTMGVFPGKLVKMAQGYGNTHARTCRVDFRRLARDLSAVVEDTGWLNTVERANTVRQVMDLASGRSFARAMYERLAAMALSHGAKWFGGQGEIAIHVFDFTGGILISGSGAKTSKGTS